MNPSIETVVGPIRHAELWDAWIGKAPTGENCFVQQFRDAEERMLYLVLWTEGGGVLVKGRTLTSPPPSMAVRLFTEAQFAAWRPAVEARSPDAI